MDKSSSVRKILFGLIIVFVVAALVFIFVVFNKNGNDSKDVVNQVNDAVTDTLFNSLYEPLESLPEDYTIEDAIRDFCFVGLTSKTYNRDLVDDFIKSVNEGLENKLRIAYETLEGDTIIKDLTFDGTKFIYSVDLSRDPYVAVEAQRVFTKEYLVEEFNLVNTIEEEDGEEYRAVYLASKTPIEDNVRIFRYNTTSENINSGEMDTFYGKIIKSSKKGIVVKPDSEFQEKLGDKVEITLEEGNKKIYDLGTELKVKYAEFVRETYPVQVDVISMELTKNSINLSFEPNGEIAPERVALAEDIESDYDVYQFGGVVNVSIGEKTHTLAEMLNTETVKVEKILEKAADDKQLGIIDYEVLGDGGSYIYRYENTAILVVDDLNGNKGIYIGDSDLTKDKIFK